MNHALIVLAAFALATPASAEITPAPAMGPPAAQAASSSAEVGSSKEGGVKALRSSCREEADSKGLKGSAKHEAVSACVVRQRPDLAGREQCRTEGFGKGLRKEELRAFVKDCAKSKG